jgi:pimeloyl-ACP methyl ester carboxylesterase
MTETHVKEYVDAGGVRTYYEAIGAGEPLVLMHGGLCAIETITPLAGLLAERFRVYMPERRATGRTPDVEGPLTYPIMAEDTIAWMAAVGLSSAHLVGWSDGATVGLRVALERPDLVKRLVLIGEPAGPEGASEEAREMMKLPEMPRESFPPFLRDLYAAASPDGPDHFDVVLQKEWAMIQGNEGIPVSELKRVESPTLVLLGEHDIITVEHARAMAESLPDGRYVVVPGADHGLPMMQPDVAAKHVLEFLG